MERVGVEPSVITGRNNVITRWYWTPRQKRVKSVDYGRSGTDLTGDDSARKSTLAAYSGEITGLPVIELDHVFWQPGLIPTPRDQWMEVQQRLVEEDWWMAASDPLSLVSERSDHHGSAKSSATRFAPEEGRVSRACSRNPTPTILARSSTIPRDLLVTASCKRGSRSLPSPFRSIEALSRRRRSRSLRGRWHRSRGC